jgi:DNA-binding CsgD family transcriptional regulator
VNYERVDWIVRRRGTPSLFVCDKTCKTLFSTPGLAEREDFEKSKRLLGRMFSEALPENEVFETLNENVILRIMPLSGNVGFYAVFLESPSGRESLESAAQLYRLTKREVEVLGLVLRGLSGIQIAQRLFITEGTVGDHMKSLFRKTKTNRRSALVARIFYLGDTPEEQTDERPAAISRPAGGSAGG